MNFFIKEFLIRSSFLNSKVQILVQSQKLPYDLSIISLFVINILTIMIGVMWHRSNFLKEY